MYYVFLKYYISQMIKVNAAWHVIVAHCYIVGVCVIKSLSVTVTQWATTDVFVHVVPCFTTMICFTEFSVLNSTKS